MESQHDKEVELENVAIDPPPSYNVATGVQENKAVDVDDDPPKPFDDENTSRIFIRKVYLTLLLHYISILVIICIFAFIDDINFAVNQKWEIALGITGGLMLISFISLCCISNFRKLSPWDVLCIVWFTVALGLFMAVLTVASESPFNLISFTITAFSCLVMFLVTLQTKVNFWTVKHNAVLMICVTIILFSICFSLVIIYVFNYRELGAIIPAGFLNLVFVMFAVYIISNMMQEDPVKIAPEDSVYTALQMYFNLYFIPICMFFGCVECCYKFILTGREGSHLNLYKKKTRKTPVITTVPIARE